jgi:SAM-dependent methyltransferase
MKASRSFRKLDGRHELRTADVMYCSFHTPNFSVESDEAQRSAAGRIARFGLKQRRTRRKTVLDLGSNAGAMLFELSNMGIRSGLGIEFDSDKVELAKEIAALSNLSYLHFEQGDIDTLEVAKLGRFDIVLALAIESHVLDPDRLYRLLGKVTGELLCFEGNGRADIDNITSSLLACGFTTVDYIGYCDDDIVPKNNNRPMFVAKK